MKNLYPYFTQNPLDRLDQVRRNEDEIKKLESLNSSLFLLLVNDNVIFNKKNKKCFFTKSELKQLNISDENIVLLGRHNNINYFALTFKNELSEPFTKVSLRDFVDNDFLKENKLGILAQATCLLNWHESHQYCPSCGGKTVMGHAGWRRDCQVCHRQHFPKVEPVVIMNVTHGDYCLLGHGVKFKHNRYSCLAGFMESGESIEDAARRELYEEAGVIGLEVKYMMSQPWPFPSTLMIGLHIEAQDKKLTIDTHELNDAKWVHKDDIKALLKGDESFGFSLPNKIAIARNLLEIWVN